MELRFSINKLYQGRGLSNILDELDKPLKLFGTLQTGRLIKAFGKGGHQDRGGVQWPPLAPSTIAGRLRRFKKKDRANAKITPLVVTGVLRNSLSDHVSIENGVAVLKVGTNVSYAKYHQYGTKTIPARPIVVFTDSDKEDLRSKIVKHIENKLNGA